MSAGLNAGLNAGLSAGPFARFEWHFADSELLAPRWEAGTLVLAFAAALVRPLGPAAVDGEGPSAGAGAGLGHGTGLGHVRGLSLHLIDAQVTGDTRSAFGRLADARWHCHGQPPQRRLSVPTAADRPVSLSLALANGTALDIQAAAWRVIFSGAPDYRESLAC